MNTITSMGMQGKKDYRFGENCTYHFNSYL